MDLQQADFSGGWMKMQGTIQFFNVFYNYEITPSSFSSCFLVIKDIFTL